MTTSDTTPATPLEAPGAAIHSYLRGLEELPFHPITARFPEMSAKDYDTFKQDVQTNGQLVPIVAINGQVVDGRHRLRACRELGIAPTVIDIAGDSIAIARSLNMIRRHMTADQIATWYLELSNTDPKTKADVEAIRTDAKARQHAGARRRDAGRRAPVQSTLQSRDSKIDGLAVADVDRPDAKKKRAQTAAGESAKHLHISESSLRRAAKVAKVAPEQRKDVLAGTTTSSKILREHAAKKKGATPPAVPDGRGVITTLESLSAPSFANAIKAVRASATQAIRAKVGRALDDALKALDAYKTSVRGAK